MSELERFCRFCSVLALEDGSPLVVEDFQQRLLSGYFAGARESIALLPKGSGKSTLIAAVGLWELLTGDEASGVIAAASRDQAQIILTQVTGFIHRTPELRRRFKVRLRSVSSKDGRSQLRVIASDADTADGQILSFAIADELHRWPNSELYEVLSAGVDKRGGRMIGITTAGLKDGFLWDTRERVLELGAERDGAYLHLETPSFHWHEWSLPDDGDPRDIHQVKAVNVAPWLTEEVLRRRLDSSATSRQNWERLTCNRFVDRSPLDIEILPETWRDLAADHPGLPGEPLCLAVDVNLDRTISSIAAAGWCDDGRLMVSVVEAAMGVGWVAERLVALTDKHDCLPIVVDSVGPSGALIPRLEEWGLEVRSTSAREFAASFGMFVDAVSEGRLCHRNEPPLNNALQGAATRALTDSRAWSRSKSLTDVTPLISATLAAWGLLTQGPVPMGAIDHGR